MTEHSDTLNNNEQPVLLVDLDGSLISTDTLYETLILLIRNKPWMIFFVPIWLAKGKQHLKKELFHRTQLDIDSLPYKNEVVDFLNDQHSQGRHIVLATGSWHEIAKAICQKFVFLSDFAASDDSKNLTGSAKAEWAVSKYGTGGYDYLGNETKDLVVWKDSRKSVVVGSAQLAEKASKISELEAHIETGKAGVKTYLKTIRLHQWAKNALLFVPLFTAHLFSELPLFVDVFIAFFCFGCCASATYIFNDLLDLQSDRKHPIKKNRPLASGAVSIPLGIAIGCGLLILSFCLAFFLNFYFALTLLAYLALTVFYSFKLKRLQTVDVITLASLFTLRVIAGGAAIETPISFWLLSFSMFLFLSLAIVKRVSEIIRLLNESFDENEKISGRGYFTSDATILQALGSSSGFLAVLVFALYINSDQVIGLYNRPEILWLMCPILGYWIMRIWMMAARGEMNEDPISFAITDRNSILAGATMAVVLATASLL